MYIDYEQFIYCTYFISVDITIEGQAWDFPTLL